MSIVDQNTQNLQEKIVSIARQAIGETMMGPGYFLNDGNGTHPIPFWCEAAAETIVFMATGERIRFPSAEAHYQSLLRQGKIHTDIVAPAGTYVFYHWDGDVDGHITVATGNDTTIGTVITPAQILELPTNHYTGYSGWAWPQEVIDAAKTMTPADPTNGGLGFLDPTKTYRVFSWINDNQNNPMIIGHGIKDLWEKDGPTEGIIRFGYPLDNEHPETNDHNIPLTIQNFERNRIEYNPATNSTGIGRVGAEMLGYWQKNNALGTNILIPPNTDYIDTSFVPYWQQHGALEVIGLPLTGIATIPGSTFPSQVFERAVLEKHDGESWPVQGRAINAELVKLRNSGEVGQISG